MNEVERAVVCGCRSSGRQVVVHEAGGPESLAGERWVAQVPLSSGYCQLDLVAGDAFALVVHACGLLVLLGCGSISAVVCLNVRMPCCASTERIDPSVDEHRRQSALVRRVHLFSCGRCWRFVSVQDSWASSCPSISRWYSTWMWSPLNETSAMQSSNSSLMSSG